MTDDKCCRIFKLSDYDQYGYDGQLLYENPLFRIFEGVTALVGCNGSGKTTLMNLLEKTLRTSDIPVMKLYGLDDREHIKAKASMAKNLAENGILNALMDTTFASEGEKMANTVYHRSKDLGQFIFANDGHDERWVLVDSIDSATSIDNVSEILDLLDRILTEEGMKPKGIHVYFVLAANSYEIARRYDCLYVRDASHRIFETYEDYRGFVLESRKEKDESIFRTGKVR